MAKRERRVKLRESGAAEPDFDESDLTDGTGKIPIGKRRGICKLRVRGERSHESAPTELARCQRAVNPFGWMLQRCNICQVSTQLALEESTDVLIEHGGRDERI